MPRDDEDSSTPSISYEESRVRLHEGHTKDGPGISPGRRSEGQQLAWARQRARREPRRCSTGTLQARWPRSLRHPHRAVSTPAWVLAHTAQVPTPFQRTTWRTSGAVSTGFGSCRVRKEFGPCSREALQKAEGVCHHSGSPRCVSPFGECFSTHLGVQRSTPTRVRVGRPCKLVAVGRTARENHRCF